MNSFFRPVLSALFAALIVVGAYVAIPFVPVPLVLANFFVILAGLILGPVWGGAAVAVYLVLGIVGLPVFAGGKGGFAVLLGPTGGFLLGYLAAAVAGGFVARGLRDLLPAKPVADGTPPRKAPGVIRLAIAGLVALVALYAVGLPIFEAVMYSKAAEKYPDLWAAAVFMAPYMLADLVKVAAAVLIARSLGPLLK
jgi:biotin transport system substrate-specific component